MPDVPRSRDADWVVPAILAGVAIVVVVVVAGVVAFASGSGGDKTVAQELETWSRCLHSEGAPVPLVESLRDGGIRITFDATVLEGTADFAAVPSALDVCRDTVPDPLRELVDRLDTFGGFPPEGNFFDFGDRLFEGGPGHFDGVEPVVPDLEEVTLDELCARVVARVESSLPVPQRLRRACDIDA